MDSVLSEVDDVVHTTSLGLRRSIITERRKQKILFFLKKKCCFLEGFRDKVETANGFGGRESKGQALVEGRQRLKRSRLGGCPVPSYSLELRYNHILLRGHV